MNDEDDLIPAGEDEHDDGTVSIADPAVVHDREKRQKREIREGDEFWTSVMASPVGRREIWRFLQTCRINEERFACGPNGQPQPEATWYHAGERDTGMRLYRSLFRISRVGVGLMHDECDPVFAKPRRKKGD